MQYTQEQIQEILDKHKMWLDEEGGEKADLYNTTLKGANLKGVNLAGANLDYVDLRGADLEGADLEGASIKAAYLDYANLVGSDISYVAMNGTSLNNVNLKGANITAADLRHADLSNANLENTSLTRVNTENLRGCAVYSVQMPISQRNARLSYWKELNIWTVSYFQGTKCELFEYIDERHKDNEKIRNRYFKAIEFIESMANEE